MDTFPPLPSDGVPCVIDDGPTPAEYPCNCTDHRVARQVEVERRVAQAERVVAQLGPAQLKFYNQPPKKRRRSAR